MGKTLDGYPNWSQNADPDPTLGNDPFAATDCGEECCSIVQYGLGKGYTTETQVRDAMPGHAGKGETTSQDIAGYLAKVGISTQQLVVGPESLQAYIRAVIDSGRPAIVLGFWLSPNVLHWLAAIGYGNGHLIYIDPWDGAMKAIPWARARSMYAGAIVAVRR